MAVDDPGRALAERLGHRFERPELLRRALTHRSASSENNERLEFLGDSVLNFLVAESLYCDVPDAAEGSLTRRRAQVVKQDTLAQIARQVGVGPALRLGEGERKSGGRGRDSILADALEALIGAVYLDAGLDACRQVVLSLVAGKLHDVARADEPKDPKTRLQEALQSRGLSLPTYNVVEVSGAAHAQRFVVECTVGIPPTTTRGEGSSRRRAEQDAAVRALESLER
ncbi:MAG: ribonuclease III [Ectothiorhodospiraceae bacterium]|nr:ribonuclease III [Ectothiorhodospiraceae bacterium]